jgi:hypothetical protein
MDQEVEHRPTEEHARLGMAHDRSADLEAARRLEHRNVVLGLWLFGFSLVLFALTAIVAILVVYD